MDEKPLVGAHLAGDLDAGFLLDPAEDGLGGLAHLRDGTGQPGIGGVEVSLALLLLDRRHRGERQPAHPLEIFIGLVGVEFPVGQRAAPEVADQVDFHAVMVKVLRRAVAAAGQLGGGLGVEAPPLPGEHLRHGVDQPGGRSRLARLAEPLQQAGEAVCDPVQTLHIGTVAGQLGKPAAPIAPGMFV